MLNLAIDTLYWRYENQELADLSLIQKLVRSICVECDLCYPNPLLEIVLSEVITNAIDHGVLALSSTVKDSANGFDAYLSERSRRITALKKGWVTLAVEKMNGGNIQIAVQDSGSGFDYQVNQPIKDPLSEVQFYGRGLLIVSSLCESMSHVGNGNCIVVEFDPSTRASNGKCTSAVVTA